MATVISVISTNRDVKKIIIIAIAVFGLIGCVAAYAAQHPMPH